MSDAQDQTAKLPLPPTPSHWNWTTLDQLAAIEGGITKGQKRRRETTPREVPYLRVANVQRGYLDLSDLKTIAAQEDEIAALRLRNGDVLFTEGGDRDKLGRGWVWNDELEECIHQNHIFRARPNRELIDPKFLSYHGNHFGRDWFSRTGKQTTNLASINKGILKRFPVPVPPIDEQLRIVAKIEELFSDLDAGVAALERVRANLKRYRASVLKAAVEGKLTEDWRAQHPDTEPASVLLDRILTERRRQWEHAQLARFAQAGKLPPKRWQENYCQPTLPASDGLPPIPRGWIWVRCEALISSLGSGSTAVPVDEATALPILRSSSVRPGRVDFGEVRYLRSNDSSLVAVGDLLFVRLSGSVDYVAACALVRSLARNPVAFPDRIFRAKPVIPDVAPYIELCFASPFCRNRISEIAKSSAGHQRISSDGVLGQPVPLPPADEMNVIVQELERRFSTIDEIEAQVDANLKRAARLRQGILKRAFEGRLVPQDPTDEPAEELLQRIRQERPESKSKLDTTKAVAPTRRPPNRNARRIRSEPVGREGDGEVA